MEGASPSAIGEHPHYLVPVGERPPEEQVVSPEGTNAHVVDQDAVILPECASGWEADQRGTQRAIGGVGANELPGDGQAHLQ